MKKFLINVKLSFLTILLLSLIFNCGNRQEIKKMKNKEALNFLTFFKSKVLKENKFVLLNCMSVYDITYELFSLKSDSVVYKMFNEQDFNEYKSKKIIWNKNNMPEAKLIDNNIAFPKKYEPNYWRIFKANYGDGFYAMSYPVVSNDYQYVIFYYEYRCGGKCGFGKFSLYKKTKTSWVLVKNYGDWVS